MNTINALVAAQGGYSPQWYRFYFKGIPFYYHPNPALGPTIWK